ncbi:hypothetical protein ACFLXY_08640, partial [Chloroflexota bacterium]
MDYKSLNQLKDEYVEINKQEKFFKAYTTRILLSEGIFCGEMDGRDDFQETIVLSGEGKDLLTEIQRHNSKYSMPDIYLAIYLKFYLTNLLIDIDNTDNLKLLTLIEKNLLSGNIKYPWLYDCLLYDKYYFDFEDNSEALDVHDTKKLLDDTPCGVYQMGHTTIGPFGILESICERNFSPSKEIHLWHCDDPSCRNFHKVTLSSELNDIEDILYFIDRICSQNEILISEWDDLYGDIIKSKRDYYDDLLIRNMPWLLGGSFSENELQKLLSEIIENNIDNIRDQLRKINGYSKIFKNTGEKIAKQLKKNQCLQL